MLKEFTAEVSDVLLSPFLEARDYPTAEELLSQLIQEHADPVIAKILQSKLHVSLNGSQGNQENQDAMEIAGELRATLIADLRKMQQRPHQKSITSFRDYVATKTYSACADYFREKNPQRWRLKNLLRYQLNQHPQFALWRADNSRWYAGLSQWQEASNAGNLSGTLPSSGTILEMFATKPAQDLTPAELLGAIFEQVRQPVEFDRLIALAAEVWNITDSPIASVDDPNRDPSNEPVNSSPGVDVLLERRLFLENVWAEVCQLPVLQRAALLLNLRDAHGGSAIFFIPYLGIASHEQIAKLLGFTDEQFSALWSELPLDDLRLAKILGITRQQVINLRKTARERLARRMEKTEDAEFRSRSQ
ncbi:MAG: hypothetical protein ND895_26375 [Pyrinomonadaceae bacterium]|nr:hypothetical protein [Pyrinomonadaceae bacterium]